LKPPIFVFDEAGDVMVFESGGSVGDEIESDDVENGVFTGAFDSQGRRVNLVVPTPSKRSRLFFIQTVRMTPVFLEEGESEPAHAEELRQRLIRALRQSGHPPTAGVQLSELVTQALRHFKRS
jgi:hypothetical protein